MVSPASAGNSDLNRSMFTLETIEFVGQPLGTAGSPRHRAFLANPFRLFMTVGNLSGVPYTIRLAGETGLSHVLCSHGDYMRFALRVNKGVANEPGSRPDELALESTSPMDADWTYVRDAALATSAFPLGFLPRRLARQLAVSDSGSPPSPRRTVEVRSSNSSPIGMDCRPAKPIRTDRLSSMSTGAFSTMNPSNWFGRRLPASTLATREARPRRIAPSS